jgi:nucleoside-diphosphate-sugar epimerase
MSNSLNILVTGSSGFIGRAISTKLLSLGYAVVAPLRQPYLSTKAQDIYFERAKLCVVGPINSNTSWLSALTNVSTVVHCAALAHDKSSYGKASLAKYREVNVSGTIQLAMQSANAGVKRFIFLSTIGVNGNLSSVPFSETTDTNPHNDYALSKLEAERDRKSVV